MVCLVCSVRGWSTSSFPSLIPEFFFFKCKASDKATFPFRKDAETLKVFYLFHAFIFIRASERESDTVICRVCACVCARMYVFFHLLRRKKYSAISLLTSLVFHILTYCLIFKLSWKSQQPLVGKTSWENFKCIYNFYLPSLPPIKWQPLQVGLTVFQRSKLLLPGMIEIQKLAMFVMLVWPSLTNIALAEKKQWMHIRGDSLNSYRA